MTRCTSHWSKQTRFDAAFRGGCCLRLATLNTAKSLMLAYRMPKDLTPIVSSQAVGPNQSPLPRPQALPSANGIRALSP